jgi:hypothetical protein
VAHDFSKLSEEIRSFVYFRIGGRPMVVKNEENLQI